MLIKFCCSLPEYLISLMKSVKTLGMPRWILVLPLLHLLKDNTKPFEVPRSANLKYNSSWAGLQSLDLGTSPYYTMGSQDRK